MFSKIPLLIFITDQLKFLFSSLVPYINLYLLSGTLIYQFGFNAVIITGASLFVPSLIILCIFPETNNTYGSPINVEDNKDNDFNEAHTIEIQPEWKEKFIMRIKVSSFILINIIDN